LGINRNLCTHGTASLIPAIFVDFALRCRYSNCWKYSAFLLPAAIR
jgi:hypothetical protein